MGTLKAVAIISGDSNVKGALHFIQQPNGVTHVTGRITGLAPGPHYNPLKKNHGSPSDEERHAGDLGNIIAGSDGVAEISIKDTQGCYPLSERNREEKLKGTYHWRLELHASRFGCIIPLSGQHSILGRAVVVHADTDDLGRGGHELSKTTGNAGARVGCGISMPTFSEFI
ncbi:hypothetical protein Leryth_001239 [Lithospermum erythrorhizon]|nr:hypothetical protein Leryth_001239 [Lithospermum erythrorhizon]